MALARTGTDHARARISRIPGVLGLDVGGVLVLSPWELLRKLLPALTDAEQSLLGPLSEGADTAYEAMLSGSITERQYWETFTERVRLTVMDFRSSANPVGDLIRGAPHVLRPSVLSWIREFVATGGSVLTFSNGLYRNLGRDWWMNTIPVGLITSHVDASETGIRKPDVRAFDALLLSKSDSPQRRVLYVDDNPHYVAAAEAAGIPGLWFRIANEQHCIQQLSSFYGFGVRRGGIGQSPSS